MNSIKLSSGYEMPVLGLGTWQLQGQTCKEAVKKAIKLGYNHIDTAWIYENQREIGTALKEIKADRSKIFITSKVWRDNLKYQDVLDQCQETLNQLQTNYLDLYLIHWPNKSISIKETFDAFKKLIEEKRGRSIGISNFTIPLIKEALRATNTPITVNQVEYHPYLNQEELLKFCKQNNIVITAYSPLARGKVLDDLLLNEIAKAHKKTVSQIALRWLLQKGIIVIPKASSEAHLKENLDIFNFELSREEIELIDSIKKKQRLVNPSFAEFN